MFANVRPSVCPSAGLHDYVFYRPNMLHALEVYLHTRIAPYISTFYLLTYYGQGHLANVDGNNAWLHVK